MQWLDNLLLHIAQFFEAYLLYIPKWIWNELLTLFAAVIQAIPAPEAFSDFASYVGSIPPGVIWFLDMMQFQYGVTVIVAAMLARFLMKFIPFLSF